MVEKRKREEKNKCGKIGKEGLEKINKWQNVEVWKK